MRGEITAERAELAEWVSVYSAFFAVFILSLLLSGDVLTIMNSTN